jgi:hypothetical protein
LSTQPGTRLVRPRRPRRSALRAMFWVDRLKNAESGDAALTDMVRWVRSVLAAIEQLRPEAAEAARWELARQLAAYTARLPKAKLRLRAGLTPEEEQDLLNPWAARKEDHR